MWWIFLFSFSALAQDDLDLSSIRKMEDQLPDYDVHQKTTEEINLEYTNRRFLPPSRPVSQEKIKNSETELGSIKAGAILMRLSDNKPLRVTKPIYTKFYRKEDEQGFKYLINKDGSMTYRIESRFVESIKPELALYEPPLRYTPAPQNITRTEYDRKLSILPEASFYIGQVQGDFMKDLFNDSEAGTGTSTQYALHLATKWKLPIKIGGVFHLEKAQYNLTAGGKVDYSSYSFGPQFKTRDFDSWFGPLRFQTQFRVSPWARATAQTQTGNVEFKFNSADLLVSMEKPIKNFLGEFVLGVYFQNQWLNLKDQPELVSVNATNETNKSMGLMLAQVFD